MNKLIHTINNLCTGTCYKYKVLTDARRSWTDSRADCQKAGGDLAKIETNDEWQYVKKGTCHFFKKAYSPHFLVLFSMCYS